MENPQAAMNEPDSKKSFSGSRLIGIAFWLNLFFALFAFSGGLFAKSSALLSESVHSLSDTLSVGVAWLLERLSRRRGDSRYTYGYRRYSLLASCIISVILIAISIMMLVSGVSHFFGLHLHIGHHHGSPGPNAGGMFVVALVGLAIKGIAAYRLSKGHSFNERSVMYHMLMDSLTWAIILVSSVFLFFIDFPWIDNLLSVAIALWILYKAVPILLRTFRIFLQEAPIGVDTHTLKGEIRVLEGVSDVENFRLWSLDGQAHVMTLQLCCKKEILQDAEALQSLYKKVREIGEKFGVEEASIEILPR